MKNQMIEEIFIKAAKTMLAIPVSMVAASIAVANQPVGLEEVIVTATKRAEDINEVPMSITAMSSDRLSSLGVQSIADLAEHVPGLSFTTTRTGNPVYTLRGIGFYESSLAAYPAVSVYMDQVPLSFPSLSKHQQFDLERVEVLKGPQGTLFGQNATGGAINYVSKKPTEEFGAQVTLGYGSYNKRSVEGMINGRLTDQVNARLAGRAEFADGWQRSLTRAGDKNGEEENYMLRLSLEYQPTDNAVLDFVLTSWKEKGETQAPQYVGTQAQFPLEFLPIEQLESPYARKNNESADWTAGLPRMDNEFVLASARAEISLTERHTLISLTSYGVYDQDLSSDVDGLALSAMDDYLNIGEIDTFNQELRLEVDGDKLRWLVGANYEESDVFQDITIRFDDSSTNRGLADLGYPVVTNHNSSDQKMKNWAVFSSADYYINDNFSIKAGIRHTDTKRKAAICNADNEQPYYIGQFFYDVMAGGAYGEYVPDACMAINNIGEGVAGIAFGGPGQYRGSLEEKNTSWTISPQWRVSDDVLVYATVSKGYKTGSFGNLAASTWRQYLPVKQESVMAYEIGMKSTLFNNRAQLNVAVYQYDYKDKQLLSKVVDDVFGVIDALQNVPESSVTGVEAELTALIGSNLTVNFSANYMDGEIDKFEGINNAGLEGDFSGTPLPATPEWQFAADAEYSFMLFGHDAFVGVGATYRSETVSVVGGHETPPSYFGSVSSPYTVDSYSLLNIRAGINSADESWQLLFWGRNVLDEYYWYDTIQSTADPVSRFAGKPATYGMSLTFNF